MLKEGVLLERVSLFGCRKVCQRIRNGKGKMESLGNDERVKFVGLTISVRWREKTCGPRDICK